MKSVMIVEDDPATAAFLADNLAADGFSVACASAPGEAIRAIELRQPDLIVLDVMLEDGSGLEVLDRVRASDGTSARIDLDVPVLVLSGRGSEVERVRGFARGADDYVVKPFSYPELVARVRALLRRAEGRARRGPVRVGELAIDPSTREVRLGEELIPLSAKEFALLHALATEPRRVVPKQELLRDVWGYRSPGTTRTVDAHACRLRKKLGRAWVTNVRGVGYRLLEAA
jgi:DNA-binding response OmpR family regulator